MLIGNNPLALVKQLCDRKAGVAKREGKIALVIEGGSLRGVYSAGTLNALCDLGLSDSFDVILGTSSGGLNAMYFQSDEMEVAESIYYENAIDKQCLNLWKFPNVLDVKWLVEEWILNKKKFSEQVYSSDAAEVLVPVTEVETGTTRWFGSHRSSHEDFERSLVATSLTPLATDYKECIDGVEYNDGMIGAAIPIQKAIDEGCTGIVVCLTQPWGYRKKSASFLKKSFEHLRLSKYSEAYRRRYFERSVLYNDALDLAASGGGRVNTLVFSPKNTLELVGSLQRSEEQIRKSFAAAERNALEIWGRLTKGGDC